jgi:hypothetical protein
MACLALASMLAYVRLLSKGGASATAAYLLASAALLYTHVYGLFFILAQHAHYPLARLQSRQAPPLSWRRWTGVHLALALLAAPVAALVLGRAGDAAIQGFWLARPTLGTLKVSLAAYAGSSLLMWIFLALAAVCALDLTTARGRRTATRGLPPPALPAGVRAGLLLSWLVVPLALPFLISQVAIPMYHTRYAIGALPAMVLLAAGGAMRCPSTLPRAACIAVLLGLSLMSSAQYLARADKEPWRDVVAHVEVNARAGDLVLSDRIEVIRDIFGYYRKRHDLTFRACDVQPPGLSEAELGELRCELAAAQAPPGRVWLVRCRSHDDRQDLPRLLAETRPRVAREQRWLARRIEVIHFAQ